MKLLRYISIPLNPKNSIQQLLEDENKTTYSIIELGIIGVLYTIAVVFAGFARLFAGWFGGIGTFDSILAVYASSIVVPMLITMWLPETLLMVRSQTYGQCL